MSCWESSPIPKQRKHISFSPAPPVVVVATQASCTSVSAESLEGFSQKAAMLASPCGSHLRVLVGEVTVNPSAVACEIDELDRSQSGSSSICESGSCTYLAVTPVGAAAEEQLRQYREAVSSVKGYSKSLRETLAAGVVELGDDTEVDAVALALAATSTGEVR